MTHPVQEVGSNRIVVWSAGRYVSAFDCHIFTPRLYT
jgi:hypothetical protein